MLQACESPPGLPAEDSDILMDLDITKWPFVSTDLDWDHRCSEDHRDFAADESGINCAGSGAIGNNKCQ
jgi:hypothetical protein